MGVSPKKDLDLIEIKLDTIRMAIAKRCHEDSMRMNKEGQLKKKKNLEEKIEEVKKHSGLAREGDKEALELLMIKFDSNNHAIKKREAEMNKKEATLAKEAKKAADKVSDEEKAELKKRGAEARKLLLSIKDKEDIQCGATYINDR